MDVVVVGLVLVVGVVLTGRNSSCPLPPPQNKKKPSRAPSPRFADIGLSEPRIQLPRILKPMVGVNVCGLGCQGFKGLGFQEPISGFKVVRVRDFGSPWWGLGLTYLWLQ